MSFILLVTISVSTIVLVYILFLRQSKKSKLLRKIPGPPKLPLLGNALQLNVPNEELIWILKEWQQKYGNRIHFQLGANHDLILIAQATDVEKVLSSNTHIDKSSDYDHMMAWLGTGLLTSQGKKWFHRRKMLTPAFHFKILDDFLEVFNEQATTLVQVLKKEFSNGEVFDIFPYITRCALDIICETAMGRKIGAQEERDTEYVKAIYRISELIQHRTIRPWLHPTFLWNLSPSGREEKKLLGILHGFTENVIAEKKAERRRTKLKGYNGNGTDKKEENQEENVFMKVNRRVAFLDLLLTTQADQGREKTDFVGPPLTDLDIREETDTFMFEGHDTTAANANWTTFLLGCNMENQRKVHEELDEIFGDDKERHVTSADISKMKYLDCCIKEALRLYPSVPIFARSIKTDLKFDDGVIMPAGTTAFIMPYLLHYDPTVYPDPEAFLPERFFPENSTGRNPFAYVPFSAGPRNCIGQKFAIMEEKVLLANIFRNFKVEAAERREDLILLAELIMRPKHGLHVKITPRI